MKTMRKITALLLALAMIFAMTLTVSAAGDGKITINAATVGETYKIYKIFDATTQDGNTAYTYTKTGATDELFDALNDAASPFTLTATAGDANKFAVTLKSGFIGSEIAVFLKSIESEMGTAVATKEADSTTVVFENLDYGYYFISKTTNVTTGSIVGVTTLATNQTINDKTTKPGPWDPDPSNPDDDGYKVFVDEHGNMSKSENTANYGDTVKFVLKAQATNYYNGKKIVKYTAYDLLGEGFENFTVTSVTVNGNPVSDYSYTAGSPATITIPWVDADGNHLHDNNAIIKIYCQADVGKDAVIGENGSNTTNTGWFGWEYDTKIPNPDPDDPNPEIPEVEEDEGGKQTVTTKVYAIAIYKTDAAKNALAGAQFEIHKGEDKIPVTLVDAGDSDKAAVYEYDADSHNYTVVTPASGKVLIKGLAKGTYSLKETVAPAGYNLLTAPVDVTATEFASSSTTIYFDADGNVTDQVTENKVVFDVAAAAEHIINQSGTELPSTGGMGTTLFYACGSILVLAAVVLLVTKKRMAI